MRGIRRVHPVRDRLGLAADDRQRRTQLMRDVGQERPSLLVDRFQPRRHRVERVSDRPDVGRAPFGDLRRIVARLDPARRVDEVVHRTRDPAHAAEHRDECDGEDDNHRQREERVNADVRTMAEHRARDDSAEQCGQKDREKQAPDQAHERRQAVAAVTPARREGLALRPPWRSLHRERELRPVPALPAAWASARPHAGSRGSANR